MERGDAYAGAVGRFYCFYIERPALAAVVGRALWGSDFSPMYRSLEELCQLPGGVTVLDIACGGGLALRWLDPGRGLRYIGGDTSPAMLSRAERTARRLRFSNRAFRLADAERVPLPDATADVCLLYNALHCLRNPQAVLDEAVRCLKPGSKVMGSMLVRRAVARADRLFEADAARGGSTMGPGGTRDDLRCWLQSRFTNVELTGRRAMAVFSGHRPFDPP